MDAVGKADYTKDGLIFMFVNLTPQAGYYNLNCVVISLSNLYENLLANFVAN